MSSWLSYRRVLEGWDNTLPEAASEGKNSLLSEHRGLTQSSLAWRPAESMGMVGEWWSLPVSVMSFLIICARCRKHEESRENACLVVGRASRQLRRRRGWVNLEKLM